jgi:2-oxoglutarate dehydrogenase E2 component (dihydrolipoamide succinyltransferase)
MLTQTVPRENANDNTLDLVSWHVTEGDFVSEGTPLADLESSKANINICAEHSGYIALGHSSGSKAKVGSNLAVFFSSPEELMVFKSKQVNGDSSSNHPATISAVDEEKCNSFDSFKRFSSAAQNLLRQRNIAENKIPLQGLISVERLLGHLEKKSVTNKEFLETAALLQGEVETAPAFSTIRAEELGSSKLEEIRLLTSGQLGLINSSLTIQWDSSEIREAIAQHSPFGSEIYPVLYYEIAQLIDMHSKFNAFFKNNSIYYYASINIAVAIDLGNGLKAPVIRQANTMTPFEIYKRMNEIGIKYIEHRLSREDLSEGSVTLSDLSGEGILHFQPLLNHSQAVVIGIGGDRTLPGEPMTVTVVFDHRVLTGREVSTFLKELRVRMLSYGLTRNRNLSESDASVAKGTVN